MATTVDITQVMSKLSKQAKEGPPPSTTTATTTTATTTTTSN